MDGRANRTPSDGRRFAARSDVCAHIFVLCAVHATSARQTAILSAFVASAVPPRGRGKGNPFPAAVGSAHRRYGDADDAAVRGERLCGRHGGRHGSGSRGAAFRACGLVHAASDAIDAFDPQTPCTAYGDRCTPFEAYLPS